MGTFAKTASINYHLSFDDQRKQTSVFRLQKTKVRVVAVFCWFRISCILLCIEMAAYMYIYIRKMEPGDFS
jgi:hypothetical protein